MRFSDFHPLTLIIYFFSVVIFTMITMHPILLVLSFLGGLSIFWILNHKSDLLIYILLFFIITLSNPFFSQNGVTKLFTVFGQRITLEALLYGAGTGLLILSVLYWFKLFSIAFKEDKITFLIGKVSPKLCVVLTMALRFIPLLKENATVIYNTQLSLGIFNTRKFSGKLQLLKNMLSALISQSVENAVETADVMNSRGFNNKKRSTYSLFLYTKADLIYTLVVILLDIIVGYAVFTGKSKFFYYPEIVVFEKEPIFYIPFALLVFLPLINEGKEFFKWKYLISKI